MGGAWSRAAPRLTSTCSAILMDKRGIAFLQAIAFARPRLPQWYDAP